MITIIAIGIAGFFLLVIQQRIYQKLWLKNLSVRVGFASDHLFEGETGELVETIENRKRLPLSMLKVKFMTDRHLVFANAKGSRTTDHYYRNDVFSIGGGERVIRTLKFQGSRRGYYSIKELNLVASDLFFMCQMNADIPATDSEGCQGDAGHTLYVYPRPYDSSELRRALLALSGDMVSRRHLLEDPFEYRGIREYQPFDDMRSINWKATAKTEDIKVNQRHYTSLKSARIFFNIQDDNIMRKEAAVEMSLRITAALCAYFLRQGMQLSCFGNGLDIVTREPVAVQAKAGSLQMDFIYKTLARVDVDQLPVSFLQRFEETVLENDNGALTCFVAPNQYDDFVELLTRYQEMGRPFVWFYPVQKGRPLPKLPPAVAKRICVLYLDA